MLINLSEKAKKIIRILGYAPIMVLPFLAGVVAENLRHADKPIEPPSITLPELAREVWKGQSFVLFDGVYTISFCHTPKGLVVSAEVQTAGAGGVGRRK